MRFAALATDYDGTLANEGFVSPRAVEALRQFRSSGRRLIMVTGRTLESLMEAFPDAGEFDLIVAENGSTLFNPSTKTEKILAEAPSESFLRALRRRCVTPVDVGHVIVSTYTSEKESVLEAIRESGLELQIIFNKGSLMVLPTGCNKATGLQAAASELGLSVHSIAGIGDAENDHAFLAACEFSAAVANALPALKQRVQLVTGGESTAGVIELASQMMKDDLAGTSAWLGRPLAIGKSSDGNDVCVPACGIDLLAGASGGGKSTLTAALLGALAEAGYQFCAIDPEGDYEQFEQAVILGTPQHAPSISEILNAIEKPSQNVIVNVVGLECENRPQFFQSLFLRLQELRSRTGRPHCLAVDEAHHFLPAPPSGLKLSIPEPFWGLVLITLNPGRLPAEFLRAVQFVAATNEDAEATLRTFCNQVHCTQPALGNLQLSNEQMLGWRPGSSAPFPFTPLLSETKRTRHRRKYAEGELPPDRSFYFRGPKGTLNLRAANLMSFLNLMNGVDDETWLHHLRNRDFSSWFKREIKDEDLTREAEAIELMPEVSAAESRARFRSLITNRYTVPA
jgi:HAD superfamily hydrolase (TIGR01484 family)